MEFNVQRVTGEVCAMTNGFKNLFWHTFSPQQRVLLAMFWILCLLITLGFIPRLYAQESDGHPTIRIAPENLVHNTRPQGTCWFADAQMIGRQYNIEPLKHIAEHVYAGGANGIGMVQGATDEAISYWNTKLGAVAQSGPKEKSQTSVQWLRDWLDRGLPAIAGTWITTPRGKEKHALLVTYLSYGPVKWNDGSSDYIVKYVDCNKVGDVAVVPWKVFWAAADGRFWGYDPRDQPGAPKDQDTLRPGRLMQATGKFDPPPKFVYGMDKGKNIGQSVQTPQLTIPQLELVPGFQVLGKDGKPAVGGHIPSNQDIKDGIQRPSDVLVNNAFGQYYFYGYDYYSEFRQKITEGKIKIGK